MKEKAKLEKERGRAEPVASPTSAGGNHGAANHSQEALETEEGSDDNRPDSAALWEGSEGSKRRRLQVMVRGAHEALAPKVHVQRMHHLRCVREAYDEVTPSFQSHFVSVSG